MSFKLPWVTCFLLLFLKYENILLVRFLLQRKLYHCGLCAFALLNDQMWTRYSFWTMKILEKVNFATMVFAICQNA